MEKPDRILNYLKEMISKLNMVLEITKEDGQDKKLNSTFYRNLEDAHAYLLEAYKSFERTFKEVVEENDVLMPSNTVFKNEQEAVEWLKKLAVDKKIPNYIIKVEEDDDHITYGEIGKQYYFKHAYLYLDDTDDTPFAQAPFKVNTNGNDSKTKDSVDDFSETDDVMLYDNGKEIEDGDQIYEYAGKWLDMGEALDYLIENFTENIGDSAFKIRFNYNDELQTVSEHKYNKFIEHMDDVLINNGFTIYVRSGNELMEL